jgi:hypothetical protein
VTGTIVERLAARPEIFPGALLLTGDSPARLDAEARRLAAILLCPGGDRDCRCESCRRAISSFHPDLLVVEPQGVQIRIDSIREALAFGAGKPYESGRRVAILSRAEMLGAEAANALLKTLEEPGRHFHWILTTTKAESLLPTIRSRCVAAPLGAGSRAERLGAWLAQRFSEEDAGDLADLADLDPSRPEEARRRLEALREWRGAILLALQEGINRRQAAPLLQLAESLARAEPECARLLSKILADAATVSTSGARPRHAADAGGVLALSRELPPEALRLAALRAADAPADNRRGNKRLHYESVLLGLLGL